MQIRACQKILFKQVKYKSCRIILEEWVYSLLVTDHRFLCLGAWFITFLTPKKLQSSDDECCKLYPAARQLFMHKNGLEKAGNSISFVKIISLKSANCVLTLRKRRFCVAKEPLLPCKTYAFGMQNNRFCNALITSDLANSHACEKYLQHSLLFFTHKMSCSRSISLFRNIAYSVAAMPL